MGVYPTQLIEYIDECEHLGRFVFERRGKLFLEAFQPLARDAPTWLEATERAALCFALCAALNLVTSLATADGFER